MTDEKRGRGRPRKETTIMPTTLEHNSDDPIVKYTLSGVEENERLYNLATRIYVAMIEREPFLANNTDTAESAIRRAKLFLSVWEKEGENV